MNRLIISVVLIIAVFATSADAASRSRKTHKWIDSGADRGMYVSGNFGITLLSDAENNLSGTVFEFSYDPGYSASGAIGYDFGNFRTEAEVAYHSNDVDSFSAGGSSAIGDGTVSAMSLMANGYYDFGSRRSLLVPYLGVGVGMANVDADVSVLGSQIVDDTATVFAYQFMAGLGVNISPNTTLTAGYRYFATADPEYNSVGGAAFDSEYQSHEVNVGVRFAF